MPLLHPPLLPGGQCARDAVRGGQRQQGQGDQCLEQGSGGGNVLTGLSSAFLVISEFGPKF